MRLLHVSDWHLGVTLGRLSRAEDHEQVLDEQVALARQFGPNLIVHTGDLFDHARPAVEDLRRGFAYLQELAAVAPVVVLAGNHDSPALFEVFGLALALGGGAARDTGSPREPRVRFVPRARAAEDGGILVFPGDERNGSLEEVRLAPLPFIHQNAVLDVLGVRPEQWTGHYADQVALLEENLAAGLEHGYDPSRHVNLFAAHLFVNGAVLGRSERPLHVSESYATRPEHLPRVSYAAFGHIHKAQAVPGLERGRYAGSPIQIDHGEEGETKTVVTVVAEPGRPARVEAVPLSGGRPLRRVAGTLEELERLSVGRAILSAVVRSEEPVPDLADRVAAMFPETTLFDVHNECASGRLRLAEETAGVPDREPGMQDLFGEYLSLVTLKTARAERVQEVFGTLLSAALAESEPALAGAELFET